MDSAQDTKVEVLNTMKSKRSSGKRFSFNKKSEEKKKKDVKKSDGEQQQQKKTKKVQAVKPVSKKPVKERPYSFEEPFPEVSGKPIDILKEYKLESQKGTPSPKKKILSKARFFGDNNNKPPKPARAESTSSSSDDIFEDNFVIVSHPEKESILRLVMRNVFFVYFFMTSWLVSK